MRFSLRLKYAEISPKWEQTGLRDIGMTPLRESLERNATDYCREIGVSRQPNLFDMMHDMRHGLATDPRDKIFALMGLAPDDLELGLAVDYRLSNEEVHRLFLKKWRGSICENDRAWIGLKSKVFSRQLRW